jgi:hypothetical protein
MDSLSKLLGSLTKVKLVKLFVFNPDGIFDILLIEERIRESASKIRTEMLTLEKMRLVKRKVFLKTIERGTKRGKRDVKRKRVLGWTLNKDFEFLLPLEQFLIKVNHLSPKDITRKLGKGGVLKLIVVSGIFIQDPESRVDLLVVGDHLKKGLIDKAIKGIEAEIGKEIRYAVFETTDFQYRIGMYDKLVRDILDFPHEKVLNKLGVV